MAEICPNDTTNESQGKEQTRHDWRHHFNGQPQCDCCGRFISYERATLHGKLDGFPSPSWEEWWSGNCAKCDASKALINTRAEGDA